MTRGPKPIKQDTLIARGSLRAKDRKPKPTVQAKQVRAPRWLSNQAKKQWRPLARKLAALRLLSKETVLFWAIFCETWTDYLGIVQRLAKLTSGGNGHSSLFGKGQEHPVNTLQLQRLIRLKSELSKTLMAALRDVGLSPAELNIVIPPTPESIRAKFFSRNRPTNSKRPAGGLAETDDDSDDDPQPAA